MNSAMIIGIIGTFQKVKRINGRKHVQIATKKSYFEKKHAQQIVTLQGINISHLGKRKIIFKMPFFGDMLVPWRVALNQIFSFRNPASPLPSTAHASQQTALMRLRVELVMKSGLWHSPQTDFFSNKKSHFFQYN